MESTLKNNRNHTSNQAFVYERRFVFGIAVAIVVVVWKVVFIKITFSWGWFEKIGVWLKLWLKLRLKKK